MIVTPAALDFYQALGGRAAIASYVEPLVEWAADMLAEALGTFRMQVPKSMEAPFMRLVGKLTSVFTHRFQIIVTELLIQPLCHDAFSPSTHASGPSTDVAPCQPIDGPNHARAQGMILL